MASAPLSVCSEYGDRDNGLSQLENATVATGSPSQDGVVLIYIDNSNVWINTMKSSARQLGFKGKITQDIRTRMSFDKLLKLAATDRFVLRSVLYGSKSSSAAKFWDKAPKFCERQITRRSTYSKREREVDQSMMLDIGSDLVIYQHHAPHGGTIIIFTGDGGMVNAVRKALDYGWNVELWAYRNSLAHSYFKVEHENTKFKIVYLDDIFGDFVFYEYVWKDRIPPERSFVLTFNKIAENQKTFLKHFVQAISQFVGMPMAGRYCAEKSPNTHLVIVCTVAKLILKEDSRSDIYLKLKSDSTTPQKHGSRNNRHNSSQTSFFEILWDRILPFLKEECNTTSTKTKFKILVDEADRITIDNPKYDFNSEISQKIQKRIAILTPASATPQPINQNSAPSTSRKKVVPESTGNSVPSDSEKLLNSLIKCYEPKFRSFPQFIQDFNMTHDDPDFGARTLEAPAEDDAGNDSYTVQPNYRKQRPCTHSFRCSYGFNCTYGHTAMEREVFNREKNPSHRKSYKYKPCDHYAKGKCFYRRKNSYLCPYSHGHFCLTCKVDEDGGGHDAESCPNPSPPKSQSAPASSS